MADRAYHSRPDSLRRTKRLVVLSDGTWQTPENAIPTNILKLTMAIRHESDDLTQQVLYYDSGVGTAGPIDRVRGGGLGDGIDVNIQELYTWLAVNYDDGDEVYMFGFSRGSYTVRSLAGLINESGLVRRTEIQFVKEAYELYRTNKDVESVEAVEFRRAHGDRIPIKLLACFDTVGSLGIPTTLFGGKLAEISGQADDVYAFHDTTLSAGIEHAIHAMSVDEDRQVFAPTAMYPHPDRGDGQLTQLYFPGGHGGVGGGDAVEWPLSDYALAWMVREMTRRHVPLAIDMSRIPTGRLDVPPKEKAPSALFRIIEGATGKHVRHVKCVDECHPAVAVRYARMAKWRPESLETIGEDLLRVARELEEGVREMSECEFGGLDEGATKLAGAADKYGYA